MNNSGNLRDRLKVLGRSMRQFPDDKMPDRILELLDQMRIKLLADERPKPKPAGDREIKYKRLEERLAEVETEPKPKPKR
jgi:hypothetical protein